MTLVLAEAAAEPVTAKSRPEYLARITIFSPCGPVDAPTRNTHRNVLRIGPCTKQSPRTVDAELPFPQQTGRRRP